MELNKKRLKNLTELQQVILLLLNANDQEAVKGKTWLQKEIFLISNNVESLKEECEYEPYFWGPYSDFLDGELQELVSMGLITYDSTRLVLSAFGKEAAAEIDITPDKKSLIGLIEDMKSLLNDMSKDELLAFIYFSFPEYAKEGVEKDEINRKKSKLVQTLYRKGKISVGKAAELENVPLPKLKQKYGSLIQ